MEIIKNKSLSSFAVTNVVIALMAFSNMAVSFPSGDATYFYQESKAGACGSVNLDSAMIAAINFASFNNGQNIANPNKAPVCNTCIQVAYGGKALVVKVVDKCEGCKDSDVDLSTGAFEKLIGDKGKGRVQASWAKMENCDKVGQLVTPGEGLMGSPKLLPPPPPAAPSSSSPPAPSSSSPPAPSTPSTPSPPAPSSSSSPIVATTPDTKTMAPNSTPSNSAKIPQQVSNEKTDTIMPQESDDKSPWLLGNVQIGGIQIGPITFDTQKLGSSNIFSAMSAGNHLTFAKASLLLFILFYLAL